MLRANDGFSTSGSELSRLKGAANQLAAAGLPTSTASPMTWRDVVGVATQRAASAREPYCATAWSSSCSWYAGERQPLLT